jgi:CubicO group peptidase (beta-lactamase class C family)
MVDMLKMDRRQLLATLGALSVPVAAWGKAPVAADYKNVQAFIDSYVSSKKLPGMVWGIRRAGEQPVYISSGTLDYDTPNKAEPNSIYRVYSMTKPTIGVAIMRLIEDGKLTLDTPLSAILPQFNDMKVYVDPAKGGETKPAVKPILIRHLLTHTAGLSYAIPPVRAPLATLYVKEGIVPGSRDRDLAPGADLAPATTLTDMVDRLAKLPLNHEPGSFWEYSVAIDVLGRVIEVVSKKPLWNYLHDTIYGPLKMVDTDFIVSVYAMQGGKMVKVDDRLASPFSRDRDLPSGGGGLTSTAIDYLRFTTMLVNEGTLDGVRILKPESVRTMGSNLMEPGVFAGFGPPATRKNGFGAAVSIVTPNGAAPGQEPAGSFWWFGIAGSQMWIDPVNKLSAVLMIQLNPTTLPVQSEVRVATYKDLAALKV